MAPKEKSLQKDFEKSIEDMYGEGHFGETKSPYSMDDFGSITFTQDYTGTGDYVTFPTTYDTTTSTISINNTTTIDDLIFPNDSGRDGGLLKINERLDVIERHLGVLTSAPDPELLEKYEALKNAYNEYKLIEKICLSGKEPDGKD